MDLAGIGRLKGSMMVLYPLSAREDRLVKMLARISVTGAVAVTLLLCAISVASAAG